MSEGDDSYTVLQAAEVLDVTPRRIYELIDEGALGFRRDEQTGCWRIDAHSVRAHLNHLKAFSLDPEHSRVITTAMSMTAHEKKRRFDFDLLVLLIIGGITLLSAGYTLLPEIMGR